MKLYPVDGDCFTNLSPFVIYKSTDPFHNYEYEK